MEHNGQATSPAPGDTPKKKKRWYDDRSNKGRSSHNIQGNGGGNIRTLIGVTGLKHIGGRIREEYLNAIKNWHTEVKLYLEMRDDPVCCTLLDAAKLPLMAAGFNVEPAPGGSPNDEAAADWLWEVMNSMDNQPWVSHVEDALESLDFGFAVGEMVLEKRVDGRLWLGNIDPRGQESLDHWGYEDDKLVTFFQNDPNTGDTHDIPLAKCVHFRYRGRKGNPQGKSLLRSLYRPYRFARNLEDMEGIGIERDIGGMPIAKLGEGDYSPEDIETLKATLKGMRKDEELYLIEPEGIEIRAYSGGSKIYDVAAVIERYQKMILMRLFAQFLKLGMDNVGTQALVQGSQAFFNIALEAIQRYLLETWNLQLVPYLFRFNAWSGLSGLPKIKWDPPGKVDINALTNLYNTLAGSKIITPTDIDEDHIRSLADLPELPEEERGAPRDAETPGGIFDFPKRIKELEDKALEKELAGVR